MGNQNQKKQQSDQSAAETLHNHDSQIKEKEFQESQQTQQQPIDYEFYQKKSASLINQYKHFEAIECYDDLIQNHPNDFKAYQYKSDAIIQLDGELEGIIWVEKKFEFLKHDCNTEYQEHQLKYEYALWLIRLKQHVYQQEYRNTQLQQLMKKKFYEDKIKCFDRLIQFQSNIYFFYHHKAQALYRLNRHFEAAKCYDQYLELKPDNYEALQEQAYILEEVKCYDEITKSYDKCIKFNPQSFEAYRIKAKTLETLNLNDQIIERFNQYIKICPNDCQGYQHKATALRKFNQFYEVIKCCDSYVVANTQNNYNVNYKLLDFKALALEKLRNFNEAIICFRLKFVNYSELYLSYLFR